MAYNYNAPFPGFNPWANYNRPDENKGFNYTQDPYYNVAQDQQKWDLAQTGAGSEDNRARVWRWTLDQLKAQGLDPGRADQATVQKAYLANIGRLHQDYAANGFDWGRSGFAGYDKFLANPVTQNTGQRTNPATGPGTSPPIPPVDNRGPQNPSQVKPQGPSNPSPTNNSAGLVGSDPAANNPGLAGAANAGLSGAGADIMSSDPKLAYQYMLRQLGWDPTTPSRFGDYLQKRFSPLLQARLAASQVGNNSNYLDTLGQTITQFGQGLTQQGGNFFGDQRAIADQTLNSQSTQDYLGGIQDQSQVEQYLNQLATLKYAGANPMIQQSIADTLARGQDQYDWQSLQQVNNGQGAGDPYLTWLRNNPLYNKYLGVR